MMIFRKKRNIIVASFLLLITTAFLYIISPSILNFYRTISEKDFVQEKSFKEMLGSNFIVGFMGTELDENTEEIIEYIKPAGIILYARNCEKGDQIKSLIDGLQSIARKTGGYKYFVMIDEEPGGAVRLGAFNNAFDSGEPNWEKMGRSLRIMSDMGINVNLAPIADYPFNGDSFVRERIPASSPESLIDFNSQFIKISEQNNVSTVLKHFPGLGFFTVDPHKEIPSADVKKELFSKSLDIFKEGIEAGSDFVMIDHAVYTNIDENIATLSERIIKDMLRNQLDFNGIIVTDDMSDMPILVGKKIEIDEATIDAIKAGNNLVMFSHRLEATKKIFDLVLEKGGQDGKFREAVKDNYQKIEAFKKNNVIYSF